MKLVIFGLTVSSSWGNGHATLWRGLCRALARQGHRVVFFERDVYYYAAHRDLHDLPGDSELHLYADWEAERERVQQHLQDADVGLVTSYCPDGVAASELMLSSPVDLRVFYDLDTPVTLDDVRAGRLVDYIGPRGLRDYDLVLSYAGGKALQELQTQLGARRVAPLYGHADPEVHRPGTRVEKYRSDLSYLGTYAQNRQPLLERLFIEPARRLPQQRFLIGGAQYPTATFPWTENLYFVHHVPPASHPNFYSSSRLTLNLTRSAMRDRGYCPPGRMFEATACGAPLLTDSWEGIETFFEPGAEIIVARSTEDAIAALELSDAEVARLARRARERTLEEHTSDRRASELVELLEHPERVPTDAAAWTSEQSSLAEA